MLLSCICQSSFSRGFSGAFYAYSSQHPSGSDKGQASCVANYRPGGANETPAGWPYAPFRSHSRWILDSRGEIVTYAGANWPGSLRPMVPEGLQYASVDSIAEQIASLGMNVIRLSFATEMIDEIYNNGHDTNLKTTFVNALGEINGTKVYQNVLKHNPHFTSATTRLDVSPCYLMSRIVPEICLRGVGFRCRRCCMCQARNMGSSG